MKRKFTTILIFILSFNAPFGYSYYCFANNFSNPKRLILIERKNKINNWRVRNRYWIKKNQKIVLLLKPDMASNKFTKVKIKSIDSKNNIIGEKDTININEIAAIGVKTTGGIDILYISSMVPSIPLFGAGVFGVVDGAIKYSRNSQHSLTGTREGYLGCSILPGGIAIIYSGIFIYSSLNHFLKKKPKVMHSEYWEIKFLHNN